MDWPHQTEQRLPWSASRTARPSGNATVRSIQRVYMAGPLAAMDAPGGGEIQMLCLAQSLREQGIAARPWRPWEDRLEEADCLHLFGSLPEHLKLATGARRRGLPVALSTIAWFELTNCWREGGPIAQRLANGARFLARAAMPRLPSWRRALYQGVDLLMPNSKAEARQLMRYFGVPAERIRVVPNGADERFADAGPELFHQRFDLADFVLYAGRIEPRKNQLGFLRAMRGGRLPIVVLGDTVPGHEDYARACRETAGPQVRFLARLSHDDPLLASAYAACRCLALASWFETPGLVALEAAMTGTPLVLPDGGCAREYFGPHARYVRPEDRAGIRRAVEDAFAEGRNPLLAQLVREGFSWRRAAQATVEAYEAVLQNR